MRNVTAVGGVLTALCLLTACTGRSSGSTPTPPQISSPGTSSSPDGAPPALPSPSRPAGAVRPSAVPGAGSGSGRCATSMLSAALRAAGPAAGNRYAFLTLTNRSAAPCRVYGYVGLGLIGSDGRPLATQVVRLAPPQPASITLRPGGSAYTRLHWSVVAGPGEPQHGPCRPAPGQVWVTPPDERSHLTIAWSLGEVCGSGRVSTTPLTAGSGPG